MLTVDRDGFSRAIGQTGGGDNEPFVASSTPVSTRFNTAATVKTDTKASLIFNDKEWIAADRSQGAFGNRLYVSWTKFVNYGASNQVSHIVLSRSTDRGATWSAPVQISQSSSTQGSEVVVGVNRDVYVSWSDLSASVKFSKSVDGGVTFSAPVTISAGGTALPATFNGGFRSNGFPAMTTDVSAGANRGNLYVLWTDARLGNPKIYYSRSTDSGATWSAVVPLANEHVNDQLMPAVTVDSKGIVHAIWYDRRNDPSNLMLDLYYTYSADGGVTFAPSMRVTNGSFPVIVGADPRLAATYMGDYIHLAPGSGNAYALWGDNRSGDPDVYFDVVSPTLVTAPGNLARVFSYPNPFRPGTNEQVKFQLPNLTGGAEH